MAILFFQHSHITGAGRIAATLRDHGFRLRFCRLDKYGAAALPPDLDDVQGIVSLGGPQNLGEDHDWMPGEMEFLRLAHSRQLPVIGVCLGAQLLAAALGGKVGPMDPAPAVNAVADTAAPATEMRTPAPRGEWGFRRIAINPIGQVETMLAGIAWNARHFCAHGQEVKEVPPESTVLASSERCKIHVFRAGLRTYGFQYHFECDRPMIDTMAQHYVQSLHDAGMMPQDLLSEADEHYAEFARLADRLCVNLATYLFPLHHRLAG